MTDRELLELAAKAAGIASGDVFYDMERDKEWNPLADDGDALRLAVKLGLFIDIRPLDVAVHCSDLKAYERIPLKNEPYAATRRAIVRAAAEIGKAMED